MAKKTQIKKIGVMCSGGDGPGMNAAVRAVVRAAIFNGLKVEGIMRGFQGLIDNDLVDMNRRSVSGIIGRGGTILKTARSPEFRTEKGQQKAVNTIKAHQLDALVVVGGDGSYLGANELWTRWGIPTVGLPGTIDNDMFGTDYTIGYDTALNTVVEAVDKIKDTASSHGRIFFIEVMGREAGLLALNSGIAVGAEVILIPESKEQHEELKKFLAKGYKTKETSGIVIVAEGDEMGGAIKIAQTVTEEHPDLDVRVSILGHIQRGGSPTAKDRVAATRMGVAAVDALLDDQKSIMIGLKNEKTVHVPFSKAVKLHHSIDEDLIEIQRVINI